MADGPNDVTGQALFPRFPGWCSFCRKNHKDVGPLAEGPDQVYICYDCCQLCANIIQAECERLGIDVPKPERSQNGKETGKIGTQGEE